MSCEDDASLDFNWPVAVCPFPMFVTISRGRRKATICRFYPARGRETNTRMGHFMSASFPTNDAT